MTNSRTKWPFLKHVHRPCLLLTISPNNYALPQEIFLSLSLSLCINTHTHTHVSIRFGFCRRALCAVSVAHASRTGQVSMAVNNANQTHCSSYWHKISLSVCVCLSVSLPPSPPPSLNDPLWQSYVNDPLRSHMYSTLAEDSQTGFLSYSETSIHSAI